SDGLVVTEGCVVAEGWRADAVSLSRPALRPGEPATLSLSATWRRDALEVPLEGKLVLEQAGLASPLQVDAGGRLRSGASLDLAWALYLQGSVDARDRPLRLLAEDRKSTRLNSSHVKISYAV